MGVERTMKPLARSGYFVLSNVSLKPTAKSVAQSKCAESNRVVVDGVVIDVEQVRQIRHQCVSREDQPATRNRKVGAAENRISVTSVVDPRLLIPHESRVAKCVLMIDLHRKRRLVELLRPNHDSVVVHRIVLSGILRHRIGLDIIRRGAPVCFFCILQKRNRGWFLKCSECLDLLRQSSVLIDNRLERLLDPIEFRHRLN